MAVIEVEEGYYEIRVVFLKNDDSTEAELFYEKVANYAGLKKAIAKIEGDLIGNGRAKKIIKTAYKIKDKNLIWPM